MSLHNGKHFYSERKKSQEKGSVLIIALLLMMVVAAISTEILIRGRMEIDQANQMALNDRIYLDLQGYQYWAIQTLGRAPEGEGFIPAVFKPKTFEWGAFILGEWRDQQGLFNLNALLGDANARVGFLRLLASVSQDMESTDAVSIVNAIQVYLARVNGMVSISELRGIEGISQSLYLALEKYITVLPMKKHEININSIDPKDPRVLLTVFNKPTTLVDIQSLMVCRGGALIQKKAQFDEFLSCLRKKNASFQVENLTYFSRYFLALGQVTLKEQQHLLYTLLERGKGKDGRSVVRLLWQSLDTR